jgi:hypothetical protein
MLVAYETHGNTQPNLFRLSHVQIPGDDPGKGSEYKVHNDVVH